MKRVSFALLLAALLCSLPISAKDKWIKIQSKHFTLTGNASERDIRTVGTKLEQFRSVFSQLFPKVSVDSAVPITVIVFKNKNSYLPFMPVRNGKISEVGGYFQPGQDINYITLTSDFGEANPYSTIFHEFVHSLTNNTSANLPVWFNEGVAEFYSMFDVSDKDTHVQLGAPISNHIFRLRDSKLLPLPQLFAVNHMSAEYNERDKKGIFYAQSWALVHYLLLGNNGQRQPQFIKFVELLNTGAPIEECFNQAFQIDFAGMEKELKNYIGRSTYPVLRYTSKTKLTFDEDMTTEEIGEAEANFYLGDLLAHQRRTDAEKYLQTAIQIDPNFAPAQASLGLIRTYTGNFEEAQKYLEKAVAYDKAGKNHLIYYYYAQALMRQGSNTGGMQIITNEFDKQKAALIRSNLQRAIAIKPSFAHSYSLLAFINMVTGEQLDETVGMLKRAMQDAPGEQNLSLQLAQIYMRQEKYDEAKKLLQPIARNSSDPNMKQNAQLQLEVIQRVADSLAKYKAEREAYENQRQAAANGAPANTTTDTNTDLTLAPLRPTLRRRTEGEQVKGMLTKMDCSAKGTTLYVTVGNEKKVFHTSTPDRLEFITFTQGVSESITCEVFNPAKLVRIVYRTNTDAKAKYDGEPIAVEFIKPEDK